MNWQIEDIYDLDMGELSEAPEHHPRCRKPNESLEGLTPHVTYEGGRISWTTAKGHFGHHCYTGEYKPRKAATKKGRAKELADAIGRMRANPDDEEAREMLAAMSNEELANVVIGSGAQKLQALKYLGELSSMGLATPEVDDPEKCPIGRGEFDCPVCGGRHQPTEVYMTGETVGDLQRSLHVLDEMTREGVNGDG